MGGLAKKPALVVKKKIPRVNFGFTGLPGVSTAPKLPTGAQAQSLLGPAEKAALPSAPSAPQEITPFNTADEMLDAANLATKYKGSKADLDYALSNYTRDINTGIADTNTASLKNQDAVKNNMVARGLGNSSIRDASLFDIEAEKGKKLSELQNNLLQYQYSNKRQGENLDTDYRTHQDKLAEAARQHAQEAAAALAAQQQASQPEPAPAANAAPAPTAQPAKAAPAYIQKLINGKMWHYYTDGSGRKVRVKYWNPNA